jgi:hypothetical protein
MQFKKSFSLEKEGWLGRLAFLAPPFLAMKKRWKRQLNNFIINRDDSFNDS